MISVDAGSYFEPLGPRSSTVNTFLTDALDLLPLNVLNLAPDDLFMWRELSKREFEATSLVSTNLVPPKNLPGKLERFSVVETPVAKGASGEFVRIGFLGLSNPVLVKPNSGFSAVDPAQAVAKTLAESGDAADFWVILGDMALSDAEKIAQNHSEITAAVLVERSFRLPSPRQVNNAVILSTVERGRYLCQLRMIFDGEGKLASYAPDFVELNGSIKEDPVMSKRLEEVDGRLN